MNKSIFNKFALLAGLMGIFGASSSKELKEASYLKDNKHLSLAKYTEDNFHNLPMKRVKGRWRVKR
jgi:hypothetical protein